MLSAAGAGWPGSLDVLSSEVRPRPVVVRPAVIRACASGRHRPRPDATIVHLGYLNPADVRGLRERGVVGDILGQFFDADGTVVDLPIHDRRIGIELSDLRYISKVVGVAGGLHKAQAILGALHGGFLDVLVTNELVAIRLLELEHRRQGQRDRSWSAGTRARAPGRGHQGAGIRTGAGAVARPGRVWFNVADGYCRQP